MIWDDDYDGRTSTCPECGHADGFHEPYCFAEIAEKLTASVRTAKQDTQLLDWLDANTIVQPSVHPEHPGELCLVAFLKTPPGLLDAETGRFLEPMEGRQFDLRELLQYQV